MRFPRGGGSSGRTRSASPAPKARVRKEIELRTSVESPISLTLDEVARRTIVDEVTGWTSNYEGESRETGGYLFGRRSALHNGDWLEAPTQCVELTFAAYAGENTKRDHGRVLLDVDKAHSVERALQRQRTRERLVGDYHSHPEGDGVPSPADLRAWMRSIEMLVSDDPPPTWLLGDEITCDCWAGIIVTRSAGGSWMYPQLHAWITRWEDYAGFICEPATLVEPGSW
jgi:proteasome lid subunit RPN8/RPN11